MTTLTKRMSEELADYLREVGIRTHHMHSEIDTLERSEILRDLRLGIYDVDSGHKPAQGGSRSPRGQPRGDSGRGQGGLPSISNISGSDDREGRAPRRRTRR